MYDIAIERNGILSLTTGDIRHVDLADHISQKLYRALMLMPSSTATSVRSDRDDIVKQSVMGYLVSFFQRDYDVDPMKIEIIVGRTVDQQVSVSLRYRGDGEGETAEARNAFSQAGGELRSTSYDPPWLTSVAATEEVSICEYLSLDLYSSEIDVAVRPAGADGVLSHSAYLLPSTSDGSVTVLDLPVSIATDSEKRRYVVSRFAEGFVAGEHVIEQLTISGADVDYTIDEEYGEKIVVASVAGTITGTLRVACAPYRTVSYRERSINPAEYVYQLRPSRGIYTLLFDRTVAPGNYLLSYVGLRRTQ
jgi:hypothetical protein